MIGRNIILGAILFAASSTVATAQEVPKVTAEMFDHWMSELNNWGRWDFLLAFAPMRIVGGTGSPLNPIATF